MRRAPLVSLVELTAPVVGYGADFPAGHVVRRHRHDSAQLVYAASGVMSVITDHGRWVVPPQRAVWVPPRVAHSIRMAGAVAMRTLYLDPAILSDAPRTCCVVQVGPLLRELILRVMELGGSYAEDGREARMVRVLADELVAARVAPLHLPERLAAGASVTEAAFDLGYDSPSAFVTMFRRALGTTPGRYFARPETSSRVGIGSKSVTFGGSRDRRAGRGMAFACSTGGTLALRSRRETKSRVGL